MSLPRLGGLWMLVAGLFFAGMGVFVKLGGKYFSGAEMVFYRSLRSGPESSPWSAMGLIIASGLLAARVTAHRAPAIAL